LNIKHAERKERGLLIWWRGRVGASGKPEPGLQMTVWKLEDAFIKCAGRGTKLKVIGLAREGGSHGKGIKT